MRFDKKIDFTAGVYFNFYNITAMNGTVELTISANRTEPNRKISDFLYKLDRTGP